VPVVDPKDEYKAAAVEWLKVKHVHTKNNMWPLRLLPSKYLGALSAWTSP
jgi:hypothetical protein